MILACMKVIHAMLGNFCALFIQININCLNVVSHKFKLQHWPHIYNIVNLEGIISTFMTYFLLLTVFHKSQLSALTLFVCTDYSTRRT
jgi:hypothetical protein